MKRIILSLILTLSTVCGIAQTSQKTYCEIIGQENSDGASLNNVYIDIGQQDNIFNSNSRILVDKDNKKIKFNSMIDVLNYMTQFGWKLEHPYAINDGGSCYYHYLLSKEITDKKQIKEGLHFKNE
jgi:hypothetical protein